MRRAIFVSTDPIDPESEARALRARNSAIGALATFTGIVRPDDGATNTLTLEHYPGYTEREIERIAETAVSRFALNDICVRHRVSAMTPGDVIVFVGTAAPHRRAAFEACDYMMDYLKSAAPFWKRECGPAGTRWIEPTDDDIASRKRWEEL